MKENEIKSTKTDIFFQVWLENEDFKNFSFSFAKNTQARCKQGNKLSISIVRDAKHWSVMLVGKSI